MYYYRIIAPDGNVSALTCNCHITSTATQIEITEEEYLELVSLINSGEANACP